MSNDVLEKVKQLTLEEQTQLERFVDNLLAHRTQISTDTESFAERRMRHMGRLKGPIWMADDFNDTPEEFKDYL